MHEIDTTDPVAAMMGQTGPEILERLNEDFEDSLLLVGRVLGARPDATLTLIRWMDGLGVEAVVSDPSGDHDLRIEFDSPVTDLSLLTAALMGIVMRARAESGEDGQTDAEREIEAMSGIRTFMTEVVAVSDVHPHLRQITFGGGDLRTFAPVGPDTFLYLLLPPPGRDDPGIDHSFTWEAHAQMPPEDQPRGGYYTVRTWRPEAAEMDVLMFRHGDEGFASAWAGRARPGDRVALWGPRTAYHPPEDARHLLLVADDTGLPAVAVILEQRPPGVTAQVIGEVEGPADHQDLPEGPGIEVTWVYRRDDGSGVPGARDLLVDAVRALPPLPENTYAWGGGESRAMTAVRRHVRDERGLERAAVSLVAYWRRESEESEESDRLDGS